MRNILEANDTAAAKNAEFFAEKGLLALDFMGSPGSGKTSVLEQVIKFLKPCDLTVKVIAGDVASSNDAERIEQAGAESFQINTGGACHLHAAMVGRALQQLDLSGVDIVLIENVGNLVCPTGFKLGVYSRLVVASVPEGDDKPEKYPVAFRDADAIILNKIDLLPYLPFSTEKFWHLCSQLTPDSPHFDTSCMTEQGIDRLADWIKTQLDEIRG